MCPRFFGVGDSKDALIVPRYKTTPAGALSVTVATFQIWRLLNNFASFPGLSNGKNLYPRVQRVFFYQVFTLSQKQRVKNSILCVLHVAVCQQLLNQLVHVLETIKTMILSVQVFLLLINKQHYPRPTLQFISTAGVKLRNCFYKAILN